MKRHLQSAPNWSSWHRRIRGGWVAACCLAVAVGCTHMPGGSSDLLLSEMLAEPVTPLATKGETNYIVSEAGTTTERPKELNPNNLKELNPNNIAVVSGSSPELPRAGLGTPF